MSNSWDRQPGEPTLWWGRFDRYRALGTERTVTTVYNEWRRSVDKPERQKPDHRWYGASQRWHWPERAAAWDAHQHDLAMRQWEERAAELRGREWQAAQALLEKAEQMLKFPLVSVRHEDEIGPDGRPTAVTVLEPGDWRVVDAARMAEVASKLARLAAEMETERERVISDADLDREIAVLRARLAAAGAAGDSQTVEKPSVSNGADKLVG